MTICILHYNSVVLLFIFYFFKRNSLLLRKGQRTVKFVKKKNCQHIIPLNNLRKRNENRVRLFMFLF